MINIISRFSDIIKKEVETENKTEFIQHDTMLGVTLHYDKIYWKRQTFTIVNSSLENSRYIKEIKNVEKFYAHKDYPFKQKNKEMGCIIYYNKDWKVKNEIN